MDSLFDNPLVRGVLLPFVLGLCLGLLPIRGRQAAVIALGLAMLLIYWMMEGLPPVPPLAAKQKLGYLIVAGVLIGLALDVKSLRWPVTIGAGLVAVLWLGWTRLASSGGMQPLLLAFVIAALAGIGMAFFPRDGRNFASEAPFLVPAAVLLAAASGAIVSLLGAFIGMAQVLGGFAALAGGYLLVRFALLIVRRPVPDLFAGGAGFAAAFAVTSGLLVVALLAPHAQPLALSLASLTFVMPFVYKKWVASRVPSLPLLRPVIAGAVIAVPASLAVLVAFCGSAAAPS